jgi:NADH dehydrogenase
MHPALAQFAIQGGRHVAREIVRHIEGRPPRRFRYLDKGMTASVGRNAAVVQVGPIRFGGRAAFFFWRFLHALYVPGLRNRLSVVLTWIWTYATRRRGALLLIGEPPSPPLRARAESDLAELDERATLAASIPPTTAPDDRRH